ncbi:MAG: class I SAM-dependent methyltransferase [Fibrobacterota bacterium]|nr:class I SAM-dependent methyltransferase [Fibrobacterota bacterium]
MKIVKHCLFCADDSCLRDLHPQNFKDEDLNGRIFSARRVTEHFHYKMVKCVNTGLVFSREILPEEELKTLYAESEVTFSEYTDIIRTDYWRPLESFSASLRKDAALEIGCSSGFFLEELQQQGVREVHGCEPSLEAKAKAADSVKQRIHTGFFTGGTYPDDTFDLICSFQTLDHLSDPLDMLKACIEKLRPGGLIYIIVHNMDGLQARIFGERSPIIDVEHVYLFNPRTLTLAVEKTGFETLGCFPIMNSYPIGYLTTHAPLPFKKQINSLFKLLGLSQVRIPLRLGNIGIVARKPCVPDAA